MTSARPREGARGVDDLAGRLLLATDKYVALLQLEEHHGLAPRSGDRAIAALLIDRDLGQLLQSTRTRIRQTARRLLPLLAAHDLAQAASEVRRLLEWSALRKTTRLQAAVDLDLLQVEDADARLRAAKEDEASELLTLREPLRGALVSAAAEYRQRVGVAAAEVKLPARAVDLWRFLSRSSSRRKWGDIAHKLNMGNDTISKNLRLLREHGIVRGHGDAMVVAPYSDSAA